MRRWMLVSMLASLMLCGSPAAAQSFELLGPSLVRQAAYVAMAPAAATPQTYATSLPTGVVPAQATLTVRPNYSASPAPSMASRFGLINLPPTYEVADPDVTFTEERPPLGSYLDLDRYLPGRDDDLMAIPESWSWQLMPQSLIYKSYLAGLKEPRFASQHNYIQGYGWSWDAVLGTRIGLLRYGNQDPVRPDGFQIDAEGAALARLNVPDDVNLQSSDFRAGVPLTFGAGPFRTKLAYYHLSSHLGDEFLLANPNYDRLNYSRDCLVLGETVFLTDQLRIYGEVAWAFHSDVSEPWEFQFGVDYAPVRPTGFEGSPFFAINGHLRQEINFSGTLVVETGWAWLSDQNSRLLRIGLQYYNGKSPQYSFYQNFEQALGMGVWYDF